jgi:hypothetical protein
VAQDVGPEFKAQYCLPRKQKQQQKQEMYLSCFNNGKVTNRLETKSHSTKEG